MAIAAYKSEIPLSDQISQQRGQAFEPQFEGARIYRIDGTPYQANSATNTQAVLLQTMGSSLKNSDAMTNRTKELSVATITQKISMVVFIFCCFSLVVYFSTGFIVVHPFVGIFVGIASLIFYMMGGMLGRSVGHVA